MHHLYIVLGVHHPRSNLLPSAFTLLPSLLPPPTPLPSNNKRPCFKSHPTNVLPVSIQASWYKPCSYAPFLPGQTDGRKRVCQKEEIGDENDIEIKINLQNIIWVNSSSIGKSALAGSAHMALVLYFSWLRCHIGLVQKEKIPAWVPFVYRLINHLPSLPLPAFPKLQLNETAPFSKYVITAR